MEFINKKEKEEWLAKYPDGKANCKKVSSHVIELLYGFNRGGKITILNHPFDVTEKGKIVVDKTRYEVMDEIYFMNYENAKYEYKNIKNLETIFDLVRRNN